MEVGAKLLKLPKTSTRFVLRELVYYWQMTPACGRDGFNSWTDLDTYYPIGPGCRLNLHRLRGRAGPEPGSKNDFTEAVYLSELRQDLLAAPWVEVWRSTSSRKPPYELTAARLQCIYCMCFVTSARTLFSLFPVCFLGKTSVRGSSRAAPVFISCEGRCTCQGFSSDGLAQQQPKLE